VDRQADHEAAIRQAAEHIERTRRRLELSRAELDRVQQSMRDTNEHLGSMAAWIDETARHLREAREAPETQDRDAAA
jgi:hypothetical protein